MVSLSSALHKRETEVKSCIDVSFFRQTSSINKMWRPCLRPWAGLTVTVSYGPLKPGTLGCDPTPFSILFRPSLVHHTKNSDVP